MHSLEVCWKSVTFDFERRAIHVPGSLIGIPDAISRLHETGQPERLARLLSFWHHGRPPPTLLRGPHVVTFIPLSVSTGAAKELETALQAEVARYRPFPRARGVWYEYSPLPSGTSGCRSTAVSARSFHSANIHF